jgi:hypothetical protein
MLLVLRILCCGVGLCPFPDRLLEPIPWVRRRTPSTVGVAWDASFRRWRNVQTIVYTRAGNGWPFSRPEHVVFPRKSWRDWGRLAPVREPGEAVSGVEGAAALGLGRLTAAAPPFDSDAALERLEGTAPELQTQPAAFPRS